MTTPTATTEPRIIVALDLPNAPQATAMATRLDPKLCRLKVGLELFVAAGPGLVPHLQDLGFAIFVDLKLHDIPNTVAAACRGLRDLDVWMLTVHASGGPAMLQAAREALEGSRPKRPHLLAVTVLTSLDDRDLVAAGMNPPLPAQVQRLGELALTHGADGLVCSPLEVAGLRARHGPRPLFVTPGIRTHHSTTDDQKRTCSTAQALAAGSSYLVIGRPILRAADPGAALWALHQEALAVVDATQAR